MSKAVSFTEGIGVRYPAPDVARGFMLILIALANVEPWSKAIATQVQSTQLDAIFTVLRVGLVNQRAYPLFAMLFGFGLMTMVKRRQAGDMNKARAALEACDLSSLAPGYVHSYEQSAVAAARVDARRLLRRRAWWMLLFGAIHGLLFPGDIIGTYAVVALVFAGLIVRERYGVMMMIGVVPFVLGLVSAAMMPYVKGMQGAQDSQALELIMLSYWPWDLLRNFGLWCVGTITGSLFTPIVLAAAFGAYLATTDVITHPERHRGLLVTSAVLGLLGALLLGAPGGLFVAELVDGEPSWWIYMAASLGGPIGAWGWLSLLALFAGPAPVVGELRGVRWVLSAVGRRSMTAYLLQSVIFMVIFVAVDAFGAPISETANVLFAWAAWLVPTALCVVMEYAGKRGPFEVLLRTAVASTGRSVVMPTLDRAQVGPAGQDASLA